MLVVVIDLVYLKISRPLVVSGEVSSVALMAPTPSSHHAHKTKQIRRVFLYPVFRDQGYMTLISQFQDTCFLFTFLEDYRKNPQVGKGRKWGSERQVYGDTLVGIDDDHGPDRPRRHLSIILPPQPKQKNPHTKHETQAATPWMCLTLYDEFLGDKGVGLLRGDVSHHLTREVRSLVGSLCLAWL